MPHLRAISPKLDLDKPPAGVRAAVRAWKDGTATPEQQQRAYRYVVYWLAGVSRLEFALPGEESIVNWRQGCRFVGLQIEATADLVLDEAEPPEPPARTMTEKARRRVKKA